MIRKLVAMPLIPGGIFRGVRARSDLGYARYAMASWRWWCEQRGMMFVPIEEGLGGASFAHMPPTIQRWHILDRLIAQFGMDIRAAIVDADTMIRWDTPDFFDMARGFSAVAIRDPDGMAGSYTGRTAAAPAPRTRRPGWISRSIGAFQPLFPGVHLNSMEYFNAGFVVLSPGQRPVIRKFLSFCAANWPQLAAIIQSGDFGTDQTPLNFMLRQENELVFFLPGAFNRLHCFPMDAELVGMDKRPNPDATLFGTKAFNQPGAFDFVGRGYVWHFTNVIGMRENVMQETWRRIRHNYAGVDV